MLTAGRFGLIWRPNMIRSTIIIAFASVTTCEAVLGQAGLIDRTNAVLAICATIIGATVAVLRAGAKVRKKIDEHIDQGNLIVKCLKWFPCWPKDHRGRPMEPKDIDQAGPNVEFGQCRPSHEHVYTPDDGSKS